MNTLSQDIAKMESGKTELSIAQIKEVLRCLAIILWQRREYVKPFFAYSDKVGKKFDKDNQ